MNGSERAAMVVLGLIVGAFFVVASANGATVVAWLAVIGYLLCTLVVHASARGRDRR